MKRLIEEAQAGLGPLTTLVASAERYQPDPFAKRRVKSQLTRALVVSGPRRSWRPLLLSVGVLLVAATAAAAGYTLLATTKTDETSEVGLPSAPVTSPSVARHREALPAPSAEAPPVESVGEVPSPKRADKPRPGEDPSQVAEAVRALRKQGDAARAQRLLDQYLRSNPHGALVEDALALSIEAAAARKDPRAAEYAKRYLARYPRGRFKNVAERALSR